MPYGCATASEIKACNHSRESPRQLHTQTPNKMPFINSFADRLKAFLGSSLNAPPVSICSLGIVAEDGTIVATYNPSTKVLQNTTGVPFGTNGSAPVLYAANGAISIAPQLGVITKTGSLAALTLAAPTAGSVASGGQDNTKIVITSNTAFAHTITSTGLIQDGVTGGAKTTATFAAFAGATIELVAYAGKWNVVALNAVTIS